MCLEESVQRCPSSLPRRRATDRGEGSEEERKSSSSSSDDRAVGAK
jgi:hypothetical protein